MTWGITLLLLIGLLDAIIIRKNTERETTKCLSELVIFYIILWFIFGHILIQDVVMFLTWVAFLVLTSVHLGHSRYIREKSTQQKYSVQFWTSAVVLVVGLGALLSLYVYFFQMT
ncbi:hypothetical protein [Allofustis seminis]|uniref:hypothetical protein n=1 Tax=Allofustis seminis TaxID=166939 RepID=UPI000375E98B|nr:hypothetical protein [Allofustis seminis]